MNNTTPMPPSNYYNATETATNGLVIALPFYVLGILVVCSYGLLAYTMWMRPHSVEHVWGGLRTGPDGAPRTLVFETWVGCELLSCVCFLVFSAQLWPVADVGASVFALYCLFLLMSAAWAPLTLLRRRLLVLGDLVGIAACAWGLLAMSLPLLGARAVWVLPVALQSTLMDLCFWWSTWSALLHAAPKPVAIAADDEDDALEARV